MNFTLSEINSKAALENKIRDFNKKSLHTQTLFVIVERKMIWEEGNIQMKDIFYTSTRDKNVHVRASEAILAGLAPDGGLFVPESLPTLSVSLKDLPGLDYAGTAKVVMSSFLTDFTEEELDHCIRSAYDEKFDDRAIAPLRNEGGAWYLELFHGATIAFKDMALSILPYLMTTAAKKNNEDRQIVILTATSGDTGKAALAGFADVPGTKIMVFYPKDGVSPIQEKQMVTQKGDNTCVAGIRGNFDDAQSAVKRLFTDPALKEKLSDNGYRFSSANSINIGRLVPQIVYYVYAYGRLLGEGVIKEGEPVNYVVPTGNFGNILAAYYASKMGIPVGKLICASNKNKVLYDFFATGVYDRNREFYLTSSPSMDILISSNLERLIWYLTGCDDAKVRQLMDDLKNKGCYEITDDMKKELDLFFGGFADPDQTLEKMKSLYGETGYLIDPHTAVASRVLDDYRSATKDERTAVIASTASPYKFTRTAAAALGLDGEDDFALADQISEKTGVKVPAAVESIRTAPIRHKNVLDIDEMEGAVLKFLAINDR